jgi:hypothetical protein
VQGRVLARRAVDADGDGRPGQDHRQRPRAEELGLQPGAKAKAGAPNMAYFKLTAYDAVEGGILPPEIEDAKADAPRTRLPRTVPGRAERRRRQPVRPGRDRPVQTRWAVNGPVAAYGVDLAKSVDWTVVCGLDEQGDVAELERWQSDWGQTRRRIIDVVGGVPTLVDSTGVGDPIVEDLCRASANVEGFKFTATSKQQLMEGLAADVQRGEVAHPRRVAGRRDGIVRVRISPRRRPLLRPRGFARRRRVRVGVGGAEAQGRARQPVRDGRRRIPIPLMSTTPPTYVPPPVLASADATPADQQAAAPAPGEETGSQSGGGMSAWGLAFANGGDCSNPCGFPWYGSLYLGSYGTYDWMLEHPIVQHARSQVIEPIVAARGGTRRRRGRPTTASRSSRNSSIGCGSGSSATRSARSTTGGRRSKRCGRSAAGGTSSKTSNR